MKKGTGRFIALVLLSGFLSGCDFPSKAGEPDDLPRTWSMEEYRDEITKWQNLSLDCKIVGQVCNWVDASDVMYDINRRQLDRLVELSSLDEAPHANVARIAIPKAYETYILSIMRNSDIDSMLFRRIREMPEGLIKNYTGYHFVRQEGIANTVYVIGTELEGIDDEEAGVNVLGDIWEQLEYDYREEMMRLRRVVPQAER